MTKDDKKSNATKKISHIKHIVLKIPRDVYEELKDRAGYDFRSLNNFLVLLLSNYVRDIEHPRLVALRNRNERDAANEVAYPED